MSSDTPSDIAGARNRLRRSRRAIRSRLGSSVLVTWLILRTTAGATESAPPPNVLLISMDDLNDWVGPLGGYPGVRTPNIDRLAEQGVTFTRAYTSAPSCNPARVSLLLGQRPDTTGVYSNAQHFRDEVPHAVTLPQAFRNAGYRTYGGGKVFHGEHAYLSMSYEDAPPRVPWSHFDDLESWDEYHTFVDDTVPASRVPLNGMGKKVFDWGPQPVEDDRTPDGELAHWAGQILSQPLEEPFFLAVGFYRPHLPWYLPQSYLDQYPLETVELPVVDPNDLDDVPPLAKEWAGNLNDHEDVLRAGKWREAVRAYLASISFADHQLGRVLEALYEGPHADDTIVVLWSDHGYHLGEKGHWRKFTLWEESTRVPLIVSAPGVRNDGVRCARVVSLLDVYPTLLELAGLTESNDLEGRSLVPLLEDPDRIWNGAAISVRGPGNYSVRTEKWRYIWYETGDEELYDHDVDPNEWRNLASDAKFQPVKEELAAVLPLGFWDRVRRYFRRF